MSDNEKEETALESGFFGNSSRATEIAPRPDSTPPRTYTSTLKLGTLTVPLRPDVKAALVCLPFAILFLTFGIFTAGIGSIFVKPLQITLYLCQGVLVARYASSDQKVFGRRTSLAALSALEMQVLTTAWHGAWLVIFSVFSLGAAVFLFPVALANRIGVILLDLTLAPLSAWLYGKYGGITLLMIIAVVAIGAIIITFGVLALILAAIASFIASWLA